MRKSKEVLLTGMEPITMKEMTVVHFPAAIRVLKQLTNTGETDVEAISGMVLEHYQQILDVLVDCSSLSVDQFREVGASDLIELVRAWVEANESFFGQVKTAATQALRTRSGVSAA